MRNILLLISLFFCYSTGYSQVISNCNIAPELYDAYEWDVSKLAVTRIFKINSPYMDSISVPEAIKDTIWEGLAAIFNAFSIPERDSVFDIYCIHNYECIGGPKKWVHIGVDTLYDWTLNWRNFETTTGYEELDDFLSEYNFELVDFLSSYAVLETHNYINLTPFFDSLTKFEGILYAYDGELTCCHNYVITYNKTNNIKIFNFELNFNYGQFFCPNQYSWKFKVDDECKVELIEIKHYISDPSESLPAEAIKNCNITSGIRNSNVNKNYPFFINPNPTGDFINITTESNFYYNISIYNILGRRVYKSVFINGIEISLINYSPGLYLINIHDEKYKISYNYKIIKE